MVKTDLAAFEKALSTLQTQRAAHFASMQEIDEGLARLGMRYTSVSDEGSKPRRGRALGSAKGKRPGRRGNPATLPRTKPLLPQKKRPSLKRVAQNLALELVRSGQIVSKEGKEGKVFVVG